MTNILVDGNNLLHRSIAKTDTWLDYSKKERKVDESGLDLTSLQKFFYDLYYSTSEFHTTDCVIYVVWDRKIDLNAKNWRKDLNPKYKANRLSIEESPQKRKVHDLCKHIKHILDTMGIYSVYPLSSEGDDIIYYLANSLDGDNVIVSLDQDFYQCVNSKCSVYNPQKKITLTEDNFEDHVPVKIEQYVKYKASKGDPSDNLKGLDRYGEVGAKRLVEDWENESKKLTPEQMEILEDTIKLVDLSWKKMSDSESKIVDKQINRTKVKANDWEMTKVLDEYQISHDVRMKWDQYFLMQELSI